jgi:hypothetical protein
MLKGRLLTESLRIGAELCLDGLRVARVSRRDVSASASVAQPAVWTFLDFEADEDVADSLARSLAQALLAEGGWYADFVVGSDHVVVFADKIFRHRRGDQAGQAEAVEYGKTMGVPEHQLDWPD